MKNIIRKQTVRFQYNGKSDGFALQKEVGDWCTLTLIPQIEKQLEPFCLLDEYIVFDKVEINTEMGDAYWKEKIQQEILFSLKKNLAGYPILAGEKNAEMPTEVNDTLFLKRDDSFLDVAADKSSDARGNKQDTIARKLDELFIYFFNNGYLPWWGSAVIVDFKKDFQDWVKEIKHHERAESIRKQLREIISDAVLTRVVNHLPGQLYFQFLKSIFKKDAGLISQVEVFLKEIMPAKISETKHHILLHPVYNFILTELLSKKGEINLGLIVQLLYMELQKQKIVDLSGGFKPATNTKVPGPIEILWQQVILQQQKETKEKKTRNIASKQREETKSKINYNKVIDQLKGQPDETRKRTDAAEDLLEGIFIDNAGAVIVAAFLPKLFEKLKIVKDGSIVNKDMAVLIVQHIVSGKAEIGEFELVLPKILCGIEPEEPVNTNKKITTAQKKEVDAMLLSAIEYWSALKNTSIPGLREAFLQRSGKLILIDNEWILQVERKSYDMLLQQLPWSFSMLKLPWMKNLLKTDWI